MELKDKTIMTSKEICERLKITKQTLTSYINKGMPRIPIGKRNYRYVLEDVIAWLNEQYER